MEIPRQIKNCSLCGKTKTKDQKQNGYKYFENNFHISLHKAIGGVNSSNSFHLSLESECTYRSITFTEVIDDAELKIGASIANCRSTFTSTDLDLTYPPGFITHLHQI